jgi:uncharacterized membrane protein YvlD (DUF360 family)
MAHTKEMEVDQSSNSGMIMRLLGRLVIIAIILAIVSYFTPGFSIRGLWSFLFAAVIISALDYLVERFMKIDASPFGNGLKGFIIAAIIIYATQFVVPDMSVSMIGAILGALAIGILDAIFPNRVM